MNRIPLLAILALATLTVLSPATADRREPDDYDGAFVGGSDHRSGTAAEPVELLRLAEASYLEGDLATAERYYRRAANAAAEPSDRARSLLHAAWLEFSLGREESSLETLRTALRADPHLAFDASHFSAPFEQLYLRARVHIARESLHGTPTGVRVAAATATEPRIDQQARTAYDQALSLIEEGRSEDALASLQRAAALTYGAESPDLDLRRSSLLRSGLVYFERAQWDDAAAAFEGALALDSRDAEAWNNLGLARRKAGDPAALDAFREAYVLEPTDNGHARNLAQALVGSERWEDAVSWLLDAVRHHDRDAYLQLQLGVAQSGRGASNRAHVAWRRAMEIDGSLDWEHGRLAAERLALDLYERGDFESTAEIAGRSLEHDSAQARLWNLLGLARHEQGNLAGARRAFQDACGVDGSSAQYRNHLGRTLAALGDLEGAEDAFVQALTLDPALSSAQTNLAQVRKLRAVR